jgi:hypothetical protein
MPCPGGHDKTLGAKFFEPSEPTGSDRPRAGRRAPTVSLRRCGTGAFLAIKPARHPLARPPLIGVEAVRERIESSPNQLDRCREGKNSEKSVAGFPRHQRSLGWGAWFARLLPLTLRLPRDSPAPRAAGRVGRPGRSPWPCTCQTRPRPRPASPSGQREWSHGRPGREDNYLMKKISPSRHLHDNPRFFAADRPETQRLDLWGPVPRRPGRTTPPGVCRSTLYQL